MPVFEERLALAKDAPNEAALAAIVADLDDEPYALEEAWDDDALPVAPARAVRVAAFLSSTKRDGIWTAPDHLELRAVLGEVVIDLREARFGSDFLDIDVECLLGEVKLILPPGVQIENEVSEILGSTEHKRKHVEGYGPSGLLVRITGSVILGEVGILEKPPRSELPVRPRSWWRRLFGLPAPDPE